MAPDVTTLLIGGTIALALASAVFGILILRRLKNENTEVSWRYMIAASVVFALSQVFTLLKDWKLPGTEPFLVYEPEAAYFLFGVLFLLGISRQHQVVRNSDID